MIRRQLQSRDWLLLGALSGLMVLASFIGTRDVITEGLFWHGGRGVLLLTDLESHRSPAADAAAGRDVDLTEVGELDQIKWLQIELYLDSADIPDQPVALYLSGLFSAEVYWDGLLLGSKGKPGASRELEEAGPIDATFHIPDGWAGPGNQCIALRMSAFHAGYVPDQILHTISLGGYRSDPRRELRHYAWPLLLSSGFLLMGLIFLRTYLQTGSLRALFSTAVAGFILVQLFAEVSRSLIAYEYQWHVVRSASIWMGALAWGLCWQFAAWSCTRTRVHLIIIPVALAGSLVAAYLSVGFDLKTTRTVTVLALVPLLVVARQFSKEKTDVILMADGILAVALISTATLAPDAFLGRIVYYLLAIHLGVTCFWIFSGKHKVDAPVEVANSDAFFSVKLAGRQIRVAISDVVYLRADGNFCELVCLDGSRYLHQSRLGQIMQSPPEGFVRIQRSHAINTRYLESLQSYEGSRYTAKLTTSDELPVSRYRIAELRSLMGDH